KSDTAGTGLEVESVLSNGGQYGPNNTPNWVPYWDSARAPVAEVVTSSLNKTTGAISFRVRVTQTVQTVDVIARPGVSPVFGMRYTQQALPTVATHVAVRAVVGGGTESATLVQKADSLFIDTP